jgi:hypothetical protein
LTEGRGEGERKGKERKGKERKGKERKGKEDLSRAGSGKEETEEDREQD